jgi:hypothetical protein
LTKKIKKLERNGFEPFYKGISNISENSWRHLCRSIERLYIRNVTRFFDIYESELRKFNHPVQRTFSADETRIITVQHRHSKVVSMRGKKEVASLTLAVLWLV